MCIVSIKTDAKHVQLDCSDPDAFVAPLIQGRFVLVIFALPSMLLVEDCSDTNYSSCRIAFTFIQTLFPQSPSLNPNFSQALSQVCQHSGGLGTPPTSFGRLTPLTAVESAFK